MSGTYNLLNEDWLPVIWRDGRPKGAKVGVSTALTKAREIREVQAALPLDTFAVYRFLLAVLHWCKPKPSDEEKAELARQGGVPVAWLSPLAENKDRFELLGEHYGFYQDRALRDQCDNPCSYLLPELPARTNIAHFRHMQDEREGLCPACCALGLVRLSAYATSGKHGKERQKPAGINGPSPSYAIPLGESLAETLVLNWPLPRQNRDRPSWMVQKPSRRENVGCMAAFTWRPRTVWLGRPTDQDALGVCTYCGEEHRLIHKIAFQPGWERPFGKEAWPDDPHLLVDIIPPKTKRAKKKIQALRFPNVHARTDLHSRAWRAVYRVILEGIPDDNTDLSSAQHRHLRECFSEDKFIRPSKIAYFAVGVAQALYQDARGSAWKLPPLTAPQARRAILELQVIDALDLESIVARALAWSDFKRPGVVAALASTSPRWETSLRRRFKQYVDELTSSAEEDALRRWRKDAEDIIVGQITETMSILQTGSPLRKLESAERLRAAFDEEISVKRAAVDRAVEKAETNGSNRKEGNHESR
jgi:hypothetical protein